MNGGQELCFTRKACSEPMVEMYQNVVFFEIVFFYLIENLYCPLNISHKMEIFLWAHIVKV